MFGKPKVPDDVKLYRDADSNARENYAKYKETGKRKYKKKADKEYATKRALELKMTHPGTKVL